jgi:cysteine-rich repeat protein
MRLGWLVVCAATACVRTETTVCGDEVCPAGTSCVAVEGALEMETRCVRPTQLDACAEIQDGDACTLDGAVMATCLGGACFPDACGDGLRGASEACDDMNVTSGDACSSDCQSTEICGNGIVDPLVLVEGAAVVNERCDDGNFLAHDGCSLCEIEAPTWTIVPHRPPAIRAYHAMVTDTRRDEVILWGGADERHEVPTDLVSWNGDSWRGRATDILPPGRVSGSLAYDERRDRVVMFAGSDPSFSVYQHDLWEWDGWRWNERVTTSGPSPRVEHAMVFDSVRDVMVLVGGLAVVGQTLEYVDETWLWDGTTWRLHQSASPAETIPKFSRMALAFDPKRGETVMFGGSGNTPIATDQTWLFDGTRWRRATPSLSPPGRISSQMAWDPVSERVILFGGLGSAILADTWAWDGSTWAPIPGTGPSRRMAAAMATDYKRGGVVLYGGIDTALPSQRDTWWFDGTRWHDRTHTFDPDFVLPTAETDTARDVIVLFGGMTGTTFLDRTLEYVDGAWFERTVTPRPGPRVNPQLFYMSKLGKVVLWHGTRTNQGLVNDGTWSWDGALWQRVAQAADTPAHDEVASAYDEERGEIVMFGGARTSVSLAETWVFDGTTWTQRTPATSPPARRRAVLGYDPVRKRVVMTGGNIPNQTLADLWTWDGTTWTEHSQGLRPPARAGAKLLWNASRQRFVLTGGVDSAGFVANDVWELDGTTWHRVAAQAPPRFSATFATTPTGIVRISGTMPDFTTKPEMWQLRWESGAADEVCTSATDVDGDTFAGCADADCDHRCTGCGDQTCSTLENCRLCPADCGACAERCGDGTCSQGETASSCPGDC